MDVSKAGGVPIRRRDAPPSLWCPYRYRIGPGSSLRYAALRLKVVDPWSAPEIEIQRQGQLFRRDDPDRIRHLSQATGTAGRLLSKGTPAARFRMAITPLNSPSSPPASP